jgi:hypothetical protein
VTVSETRTGQPRYTGLMTLPVDPANADIVISAFADEIR